MRKDRSLAADGLPKSGLKLIGAKTGQKKDSPRKLIYTFEPPNISRYIEPFIGSASILFGKDVHEAEYINDINCHTANFFKVLRDHPRQLFTLIEDKVKDIDEIKWKSIRDSLPETITEDPTEMASRLYVTNKYASNGVVRFNKAGKCNSSYCKTTKGRGIYDIDWIMKASNRLSGVGILNLDYAEFMDMFEVNKNAWVILDPPYEKVETKYDKINFKTEDHLRLRDMLVAADYNWLLTINDTDNIRKLYDGFNLYPYDVHYSCSNTSKGRGNRPELIITNYNLTKDGRDIRMLCKERDDNVIR